jgi:hypothetical protein
MDRRTRRVQRTRVRARRTKVVALLAVAVAATAMLMTSTLGGAQEGPREPRPQVDNVELTPEPTPVGAGWEGQVGTDANLVAVEWVGDQSAEYTFDVRNGRGDWHEATESGVFDTGPDRGTKDARAVGATPDTKHVSEPVWVGHDVTGVRVRLDNGSAQDVKLHVIDSTRGKKPEKNVESTGVNEPEPAPPPEPPPSMPSSGEPQDAPPSTSTTTTTATTAPAEQGVDLGQGLAVAALASLVIAFVARRRRVVALLVVAVIALAACAPMKKQPPGNSATVLRSQWGGDLSWNWGACPGGPEYSWVGAASVHHTVNSNFYRPGDAVGMIRGIYAYHVFSLGYCDIAYNFFVDNYGTAYEGRWGGMDQPVIGAHTLNFNSGTTGIAVLGTFSSSPPSAAAQGTLTDLIRWKFKVHGVNPFDDPAADVYGHRDLYQTECPGQAFYNLLPAIRHWVKAGW